MEASISNPLVRRQEVLGEVFAKFRGKDMDWANGVTCVHIARFVLRKMGHKPKALPRIQSEIGARRALTERGWSNVIDMLDAQPGLMRIAPAMMWPSDLCASISEDGFGSIHVSCGGRKIFGFHPDASEAVVIDADLGNITAAWRT